MKREQIEQAMQQASKTIKAIESRKESIILSASSVLEDKKLILDLCERVIELSEALELANNYPCRYCSLPDSIRQALERFGVK